MMPLVCGYWPVRKLARVVVRMAATTTTRGVFNRWLRTFSLTDASPPRYAYAAPTMIFLMRMYGLPCEMLLVCVGWPLASPPVPNIFHVS
jgi:hypothetical protein